MIPSTGYAALFTFLWSALLAGRSSATEALPPCTSYYKPFEHVGCFKDSRSARALSWGPRIDFGTATIEKCTAACKCNGYKYAGLEYYGECFCGATIASDSAPDEDCNAPCNGNKNQTCGGFDRLSIYLDPTFDTIIADYDDYQKVGCYSEGSGGRALEVQIDADIVDPAEMTNERCANACGVRGYPYAGTEWSRECYCGIITEHNSTQISDSECSSLCAGDSTKSCGGARALSLFLATILQSKEVCGYKPPPPESSTYSSTKTTPTPSSSSSTDKPPTSTTDKPPASSTPDKPPASSTPDKPPASSTPDKPPTSSTTDKPPTSSSSKTVITSSTSTSTTWTKTWSSTLWTSSTISIPSNSYTAPPYTPTQSSKPPPAPTPSCICATPAPWAGNKCVGSIPLPCVGCNDNKSQRNQFPFKLYNSKDFGRCKAYKPFEPRNACYDACKTQWQWCRAYVDTLKGKKHGPRHNNKHGKNKDNKHGPKHGQKHGQTHSQPHRHGQKHRDEIRSWCDRQYSDCYKANSNTNGDGKCKADKQKQQWESQGWYDWLNGWLGKWGFRG